MFGLYVNRYLALKTAWDHFVVNREPKSLRQQVFVQGCAYRGDGVAKCAIGLLISDEEYAKCGDRIEGMNVAAVSFHVPRFDRDLQFLIDLQQCHDLAVVSPSDPFYFNNDVECRLRALAERWSLPIPS